VPDAVLARIAEGGIAPLYLVSGDRVVAEPAAQRIAEAAAAAIGCEVEHCRRPAELGPVLADLRTLSLFGAGKVVMVIESRVLADAKQAAELIDDAREALPLAGSDLTGEGRRAAGRLLQALRLFAVDPYSGSPEAAVGQLPAWAFQGGSKYRRKSKNRPRPKAEVGDLKSGLAELLAAARAAELQGWAETELAELSDLVAGGLPPNHTLILVERSVAADHPLVEAIDSQGTWVKTGEVETGARGVGYTGLDAIAKELEDQTGVGILPAALQELARRTLQQEDGRQGGGVKVDSTERLAGEYLKLASLAGPGGTIERSLVEETVDDRGDENVWKILDAIGDGQAGEALRKIDRYLAAAEDPIASRLSLFALLADFARSLTAVAGMARIAGVPRGERNYNRFKAEFAPRLQAEREGLGKNPIGKPFHAYRLFKAYQAASRLPADLMAGLPARILEAEIALKGGSRQPQAVLAGLVTHLAGPSPAGR
jgi:hypothetical protein